MQKYKNVHTTPNTQFGGVQGALRKVVYHSSIIYYIKSEYFYLKKWKQENYN